MIATLMTGADLPRLGSDNGATPVSMDVPMMKPGDRPKSQAVELAAPDAALATTLKRLLPGGDAGKSLAAPTQPDGTSLSPDVPKKSVKTCSEPTEENTFFPTDSLEKICTYSEVAQTAVPGDAPLFEPAAGSKANPLPEPEEPAETPAPVAPTPTVPPSEVPAEPEEAEPTPSDPTPSEPQTSEATPTAPAPTGTATTDAPRDGASVPSSSRGDSSGAITQANFVQAPQSGASGEYFSPNWVQATTPTSPSTPYKAASAYDKARQQIVLFGGAPSNIQDNTNGDTWIWASGTWTKLNPATKPPARFHQAMAWSPEHNAVVMTGGQRWLNGTSTIFNDTWKWTGTDWVQLTPTGTLPPERAAASMVWSQDLQGLVMFGGQRFLVLRNDMWLLKNNVWSQLVANGAAGAPPVRSTAAMSYSEANGHIVLFGGLAGTSSNGLCPNVGCAYRGDTWVYDNGAWTQQTPAHTPSARADAAIAYDPGIGGPVLYGGFISDATTATIYNDTWAWNGVDWLKATGIASPPSTNGAAMAATDNGQVVMYGRFGTTTGQTWTYDTNLPVLSIDLTGASGGTTAAPVFYTGDAATVKITATNTGVNPIDGNSRASVVSALDGTLLAGGSLLTWAGNQLSACAPGGTSLCGLVESLAVSVANITIPAGVTNTSVGNYVATVLGSTRGCSIVNVPATASSILGASATVTKPMTVCGGGLGTEDWWTYDSTDIGNGGSASVNVANGNLVVKQADSTPIQNHGDLAFSLGRVYNSQENMNGGGPLGAGWQFDIGETGESAGSGFGIAGLKVPSLQTVSQPLSMTYVDRDGTRHVFALRSLAATVGDVSLPIDLSGGAGSIGESILNLLNPATLPFNAKPKEEDNLPYSGLCIDQAYQAAAGTDMYLFRYVGVGSSGCSNAADPQALNIGWSLVRPDRVRYDFNVAGKLIRVTDAAGNVMVYEASIQYGPTQIYARKCTPQDGAACPRYTINYDAGGAAAGDNRHVKVTDPAGRVTSYVVTKDPIPQLLQVWDPGNPISTDAGTRPSASYTYKTPTQNCQGSAPNTTTIGAMCSVTDAKGKKTTFTYTPSFIDGAPIGADRVLSVTDRRGNDTGGSTKGLRTQYGYTFSTSTAVEDYVTADMAAPVTFGDSVPATGCNANAACQRNRYRSIDERGRIGEIDRGSANDQYVKQAGYFWDGNPWGTGGAPGTCRQPDNLVDNNLCQVITRAVPRSAPFVLNDVQTGTIDGVSVADQGVGFQYGDMGQLLRKVEIANPAGGWSNTNANITTYGTHDQYFDADGRQRSFDNSVTGSGNVQSTAGSANYAPSVKTDSPIAYYRLGEKTGTTMADASAGGNSGVYATTTQLGQPGAVPGNTAVGLAPNAWTGGVSSLAGFASGTSAADSDFTVESWVKSTSTATDYQVSYGLSGNQQLVTGRYSGGLPWVYMQSDAANGKLINVVGTTPVTDGQWHHVVISYDGSGQASGVKMYVDGQASGTTIYNDTLDGAFAAAGSPLSLGYHGTDLSYLDEVALYSKVLSPARINAHRRAAYGTTRIQAGTLYGVTDQTQILPPRGNAPGASWGDYLTTMRLDVPADGELASANKTSGSSVCGSSPTGNTGLVCETSTPASAGVSSGDCTSPSSNLAPGSPTAPVSSGYSYTCTTYTYDEQGQRTAMRSPKAHETGSSDKTTYTYYKDVPTCDTSGEAPKARSCDLTRSISAGGWLKAVTDPNGKSVVYAYDRAGNVARTWDRNATNGKSLDADWTNAANPPSMKYAEKNFATPVTSAALSASYSGTVVVRPDGTVSGSGTNATGELGTGSTASQSTPVAAKVLSNVVQVGQTGNGAFSGCKITFALTGAGEVFTMGAGTSTPTRIAGLSDISSIAPGGCGLLALDGDGNVWGWGSNSAGQIGNGSAGGSVSTPVQVLSGVASIGSGTIHSLAVKTDGSVWTWGANNYGQLGTGDTSTHNSPTKIPSFSRAAAISGGVASSYVIKRDGSVWSFGDNTSGALGIGSTDASSSTPKRITSLGEGTAAGLVREIAGTAYGAAALMTDGRVRAWGLNNGGQLGGATTDASAASPVLIPGVSDQAAISGGWATYLTANRAGATTIWGDTGSNQRGDGTSPATSAPSVTGHTISPYDVPWKYSRASRDPVGNLATQVTNSSGEQRVTRPARGNAITTSAFDVTATFDANGNRVSAMTPMEREGTKRSTTTFDPFGNATRSTDPRGNATLTSYDIVNRANAIRTTRADAANSPASVCVANASASDPWASAQVGHKVCVLSSTYDGADHTITTTDQNSQTSKTTYDGVGRKVRQTSPRNSGAYTNLSTIWNYDRDGNVTDVCPPRQFDSAHEANTTTGCTSTGAYSSHTSYDRAGRAATQTSYRVTSATTATALISSTTFDADGNPIISVDANGHDTTFTYDLLGRRLTQSAPRSDTKRYSTKWNYDAAGNVTSIQAPGSLNIGSGRDGRITVDGTTAANSSDGIVHNRANPFLIPDGAQYRSVRLTGGGWIKSASPVGLMFSATEDVTICATCGVDQSGTGYKGGAGGNNGGLGSANGLNAQNPNSDGNNGNGGHFGYNQTLSAGGGGGGGHKTAGTAGLPTPPTPGGAAGLASGTEDFSDVGTDYLVGSGGGGGGGGQALLAPAGGSGGNGGGYVRITASTVTVAGQIDASGKAGITSSGNSGAGGGGAGGGIWLAAPEITLGSPNVLNVSGGAGGTTTNNLNGGSGASGYVRIDADTVSNPPAGANRTRAANITSYSYDANNRVVDTLLGAQTLSADPTVDASSRAVPDAQGLFNTRTRNVYDPDGRVVSVLPPQAFTDAASLNNPKTDTAGRTDFDLNGRAVATYDPRYNSTVDDKGTGNDGGTGVNQQAVQCPTGAKPQTVEGLGSYASDVGVCVTRTVFDANGNVAVAYMPTSSGDDNRRTEYTYSDDNLPLSVTGPDPSGSGRVTISKTLYDGVGRPIKTTDAQDHSTVTTYTADGLVSSTNAQGYTIGSTTVTHLTQMGYDANGQQTTSIAPNGSTSPANFTTTTTYSSDGLTAAVSAPGTSAGSFNTTNYTYDLVGNPLTVKSPEQVAAGTSGKAAVNTFTWDNMIATTANPIEFGSGTGSYRTTRYSYTPSGQKSSAEIARCDSANLSDCTPSNAAWHSGGTTRYTYAPNGLNVDQIGKDNKSITKEYDQAGRVKKITDPTSDITISANYYLDGLLRTVGDNKNSNTYAYDARGQVSARSDETPSNGVTGGAVQRTSYGYNDAGLPTKMTSGVNSGNTTSMSYDSAGRLLQKTDNGGSGQTTTYDPQPDNTLGATETKVSGSTVAKFEYKYDNNGNIKNQAVTGSVPNYANTYSYNPANNITDYTRSGTSPAHVAYTWDRNANRLTAATDAQGPAPASTSTWTYRVDNSIARQVTTSRSTRDFNYSNAGLLTSDGCNTFTYDDFDRSSHVATSGSTDCGGDSFTTDYTYDGLDRQRTANVDGSTEVSNSATKTVFDGLSNTMVGQINAATNGTTSPNVLYQLGPDGSHVAMKQTVSDAATSYLIDDGQGNISTQITTGGNTACEASYDPFGNPGYPTATSKKMCAAGGSQAATTGNAAWYRDQTRDGGTGNYQLGARTYSPALASFTGPDNYRVSDAGTDLSVGVDPLTQNTYTYVNGNPVNAFDPTGHFATASDDGQSSPSGYYATDGFNRYYTTTKVTGQGKVYGVRRSDLVKTGRARDALGGFLSSISGTVDALSMLSPQRFLARQVGLDRTSSTLVQDFTDWATGAERGTLNYQRGEAVSLLGGLLTAPAEGSSLGLRSLSTLKFGRYGSAARDSAETAASIGRRVTSGSSRPLKSVETAGSSGSKARVTKPVAEVSRPDSFAGVREASQYMRDAGVPRSVRKEVVDSFERGTISVQKAGTDTYGLRYFGDGSGAVGRYLTPTFPAGRSSLALPPGNSMGSIAQFRIQEGATYFSGRVGPNFGQPGGGTQYFVPNLADLSRQ